MIMRQADVVRSLQTFLRTEGFYVGEIDAKFGPASQRAWKTYKASLEAKPGPDLAADRLSPHFTLAELTVSAAAARLSLDNSPTPAVLAVLRQTAQDMERVRSLLGNRPILVTSGYRSDAVNRAVGGSATSAHRTGHAVDFTCPSFGSAQKVAHFLAQNLPRDSYDQIIDEFGSWVHIGFGPGKRGQTLTARKVAGRTVYTPGISAP